MSSERSALELVRDFWNQSPLTHARAGIVIVGVLLPYVARIPGAIVYGREWIDVYLDASLGGFMFLEAFNAMAWGSLFVLSYLLRKPSPLIFPSLAGFGFLGFAHGRVDLSAAGHAGVALVYIPILALPIIAVAFVFSVAILGRGPRAPTSAGGSGARE